jgi:hypothetical protein
VAELVDARDLKSLGTIRTGSTPVPGIFTIKPLIQRSTRMDFSTYYRESFRTDLRNVIHGLPPIVENCVGPGDIQPRTLSRLNPAIRLMSAPRRALFSSALYLTVLVDQVMHSHFHSVYERFRSRTWYPKLKGDCPGACSYHIHPDAVFNAINKRPMEMRFGSSPRLSEVLASALPAFEAEVMEFFRDYMPDVDGANVWRRCLAESPLNGLTKTDEKAEGDSPS